jgi:hypothetical protein
MGTRHLTCVVKGGEYKVAQYGQWDGYPSGQGSTILDFLHKAPEGWERKIDGCTWIDGDELKAKWVECGADPDSDLVSFDVSSVFAEKYPELSRDTGARVLQLIADSDNGLKLENSLSFANDSLFCEYAYVVDLDKGTFEVYKGFNSNPLDAGERFYSENPPRYSYDKTPYYPVKHKFTFQLSSLPSEAEFLATLEPEEVEE